MTCGTILTGGEYSMTRSPVVIGSIAGFAGEIGIDAGILAGATPSYFCSSAFFVSASQFLCLLLSSHACIHRDRSVPFTHASCRVHEGVLSDEHLLPALADGSGDQGPQRKPPHGLVNPFQGKLPVLQSR